MQPHRWLPPVLGLLAVAALVAGTGGFGSIAADRGVTVAVTDDERAYLGITVHDPTLEPGAHDDVVLLTLRNQFEYDLTDVSVTVTDDENTPPLLRRYDAPTALAVGERGDVTADVTCGGQERAETWTVTVVASGPGGETTLSRQVTVTCLGGQEPTTTTPPDPDA